MALSPCRRVRRRAVWIGLGLLLVGLLAGCASTPSQPRQGTITRALPAA